MMMRRRRRSCDDKGDENNDNDDNNYNNDKHHDNDNKKEPWRPSGNLTFELTTCVCNLLNTICGKISKNQCKHQHRQQNLKIIKFELSSSVPKTYSSELRTILVSDQHD